LRLKVCTKEGIKQITISKRNGEIYKTAKKAKCGDEIELPLNMVLK
jgi:ribosomal protein RSM22 (predicted rRNA methylase)